jgi:hypothetical protein
MRAHASRATLALLVAALAAAFGLAGALAPESAHAAWRSPAEIVQEADQLDGRTVPLAGEAIGDKMRADSEHVWINVLGDGIAVGVYIPDELAEPVTGLGDYDRVGDRVNVEGVVNVACEQHGGDLDVHAVRLDVLEPSTSVEHYVPVWEGVLGVALIVGAGFLFRSYRARRLGWVEARRR